MAYLYLWSLSVSQGDQDDIIVGQFSGCGNSVSGNLTNTSGSAASTVTLTLNTGGPDFSVTLDLSDADAATQFVVPLVGDGNDVELSLDVTGTDGGYALGLQIETTSKSVISIAGANVGAGNVTVTTG